MTATFATTGSTSQSTPVTGLQDGGVYSYYVRCQDSAGANGDDYVISFSVGTSGGTLSSNFTGTEIPLSENGVWSTPGSWDSLSKNNGALSMSAFGAARLVSPVTGADQYAQISYDQDPGTASWSGVMTRVQGAGNGSGYLAIAYAGTVRLYRADDNGGLDFSLLASANADVGASPRMLRLESQGATHTVYFNGVLMFTYTDARYANGQPGIADSVFGGPTVRILSFTGGSLVTGGGDTTPPGRSNGQPAGVLAPGTSQAVLSLTTDESATCRYSTTPGVSYGSMTATFATTGSTSHSTPVTGLQDGGAYSYYVRCRDSAGNANGDDYVIGFSVGTSGGMTSNFTGTEAPLSENGVWSTAGSWASLSKNNGAYSTSVFGAARLVSPVTGADQYAQISYDQDPGTASWPGVMTRIQGAGNGSGYLAIAYAGTVRLYRVDDNGGLSFSLLASANADVGASPRVLRLESQGTSHSVYFNGVLMFSYSDGTYVDGQPGIADSVFGGPTVRILSFTGGSLATGGGDTTPPVRSNGQPAGVLASGTSQAVLSLTTDESATCRYSTTFGVSYGSMTATFATTGSTSQSTPVTGLQDGELYIYYVRCQDSAGNANGDDYVIGFSVGTPGGAISNFTGTEIPLSENGQWSVMGSWASLSKNNGAYSTSVFGGNRLVSPVTGADQYAQISYDQDPGTASWPGVMTRVQGAANGSGYLAIAYAGTVRLYRADDNGGLNFSLLASASADVGASPRVLRLESQGATHSVYFNGVLMFTYTDGTYANGQPGIADSVFGGPTVRILSFNGGALP
jgi:hypothetical protein